MCHDPATMRDRHGRLMFETVNRTTGKAWKLKRDDPHPLAGKATRAFPVGDGSKIGLDSPLESSEDGFGDEGERQT
jgi:hypothetical protein